MRAVSRGHAGARSVATPKTFPGWHGVQPDGPKIRYP